MPHRLANRLRGHIRLAYGRSELPTAAVIDAQTVRGAGTVAATSAGYDAGNYAGVLVMSASSLNRFLGWRFGLQRSA